MCISLLIHKLKELKDCNTIFLLASLREEHPYYPPEVVGTSAPRMPTPTLLALCWLLRAASGWVVFPPTALSALASTKHLLSCLLPKGQSWKARLAGSEFPSKSRPSERHLHCMPFWEHWLRSSSVSKSLWSWKKLTVALGTCPGGLAGIPLPTHPRCSSGSHPSSKGFCLPGALPKTGIDDLLHPDPQNYPGFCHPSQGTEVSLCPTQLPTSPCPESRKFSWDVRDGETCPSTGLPYRVGYSLHKGALLSGEATRGQRLPCLGESPLSPIPLKVPYVAGTALPLLRTPCSEPHTQTFETQKPVICLLCE